MKTCVYLAGPINGLTSDQQRERAAWWRRQLGEGITLIVPEDHRAAMDSFRTEPREVWREDMEGIGRADAVLADLTSMGPAAPSLGSVAELTAGRLLGKRVAAVVPAGCPPVRLHPFIAGPCEAVFFGDRTGLAAYCRRELVGRGNG